METKMINKWSLRSELHCSLSEAESKSIVNGHVLLNNGRNIWKQYGKTFSYDIQKYVCDARKVRKKQGGIHFYSD